MKAHGTTDLVVLSAKRTPFGTFGGALKNHSATDLGVLAARAALMASGVAPTDVDQVVFGNVMQTSPDAIYLARHVGLRCELPHKVPALTVNRLCGSGFQAIVNGAEQILLGDAQCVLVGGTESMSQAPFALRDARWGVPFGKTPPLEDTLWSALTDTFTGMPMAMTAEKLAETHKISQETVDAFSVRSQKLHAAAQRDGRFADELVPVEVKKGKETIQFVADEHGRPDTTVESLGKLPKVFKKDGVIHAGAASGICDGAAALVIASRAFAEQRGLKPIARLVNWGIAGVDPTVMGIGPVPAIRACLQRAGGNLDQVDLVEINEAFAPQALACAQDLGLDAHSDKSKLNVDGGAIALGHPLGASGARITTHLVHALRGRKLKYGLGSACIGGGQGIALLVEAL
ncbi:MAG: acetyl-CoA C-acetyltransferase [Deltaproteobacteria bacterium]|nr:acetyl-CoA C-acetyltransferase [Deltaproteobacteria bacterium]